jgi:hypothetical protein
VKKAGLFASPGKFSMEIAARMFHGRRTRKRGLDKKAFQQSNES